MKIVNPAKPPLTTAPVASVEMYPDAPNQDDMHWFAAQLQGGTTSEDASSDNSTDFLSGITGSISDNQRTQKSAFRDLSIASKSSNPMDFSKANSQLSDYYIETMMSTKIISKTVQAVDKLNNQQ